MRRFTRLTNGFRKKTREPYVRSQPAFHVLALLQNHNSLRVTPAMKAKVDNHVWTMEEVIMMEDTMG